MKVKELIRMLHGLEDFDLKDCGIITEMLEALDAQPVVHGHWIKNEGRHGWHCSVCGVVDFYAFAWNSDKGENELQDRYCPICGAKMEVDDG